MVNKGKRLVQDRHEFASRLLLTIALLVIGFCMVSMYRRTVHWRERQTVGDTDAGVQELMSRLPHFPDFSGTLWLNGMQVQMAECAVGEVSNHVHAAVSAGWLVHSGLSEALSGLSLQNGVALQRGETFRFMIPVDADARGSCLWIIEGDATTVSQFSQSTLGGGVLDVAGQDLPGVIRPAEGIRVFSLLNDVGEGMVTYRFENSSEVVAYGEQLHASGWEERAALLEGVIWYSKDDISLYTYDSGRNPHDGTIWLTLISAKSDYKK